MPAAAYVLVTPARNEARTIETTIRAVLAQTLPPQQWVIVSDGSTDETDNIVKRFSAQAPHIRLLGLGGPRQHSFASVVRALECGIREVGNAPYDYLGLLDADVRFASDYYERLVTEFGRDERLGLGGGLVVDIDPATGRYRRSVQNLNEVAGATQFFRRQCFEAMGGLVPIPEGGWDAITCVRARMNGYHTRTFPELVMEHLKPRNSAFGNPVRRKWQMGVRDYALAAHPFFEVMKCARQMVEFPQVIGGIARLTAFFSCALSGKKTILPPDVVAFLQGEQLARILPFLSRPKANAPRAEPLGVAKPN